MDQLRVLQLTAAVADEWEGVIDWFVRHLWQWQCLMSGAIRVITLTLASQESLSYTSWLLQEIKTDKKVAYFFFFGGGGCFEVGKNQGLLLIGEVFI